MIKRILVGIADALYTVSATKHALEIAKAAGATLTGISVLDDATIRNTGPVALGAGQFAKEWRETRFKQIDEAICESFDAFIRLADEAGIDYVRLAVDGDPMTKFIDSSRYHDLAVVGLHHLFEHGLLADPPDALVKLISAGVHPMLAVAEQYRPVKRALITYSGSIESARSVRCFTRHRYLWPDAQIKVVSFGKSVSVGGPAELTNVQGYLSAHGIDAEIDFVEGSSKHLLDYANDWNADMIVLGNSAKNLIRRRIFGETALKTIREAKIPLFLSQ